MQVAHLHFERTSSVKVEVDQVGSLERELDAGKPKGNAMNQASRLSPRPADPSTHQLPDIIQDLVASREALAVFPILVISLHIGQEFLPVLCS